MSYANPDQLIADYIPEATSDSEIAAIGRILISVCAFVDSYCRRAPGYFSSFDAPSSGNPTVKRVRGEGERFLRLPVHINGTVTEVKTSYGSLIDSSNYYESEKNGWLYADTGGIYPQAAFDLSSQEIWSDGAIFLVKARWGFIKTPMDVQEAVRLTVLRVWETQKGTLGQITPGGFVVERALPPFAREILDRYKRREFEI